MELSEHRMLKGINTPLVRHIAIKLEPISEEGYGRKRKMIAIKTAGEDEDKKREVWQRKFWLRIHLQYDI